MKDTKNVKVFLNKKNLKMPKGAHTFTGHGSSFNVKILSSFNPELQPKDSESANENKIKDY